MRLCQLATSISDLGPLTNVLLPVTKDGVLDQHGSLAFSIGLNPLVTNTCRLKIL